MAGSLSKECRYQVEVLIAQLRRRQIVGSYEVSLATTKLLRNIVASSRCRSVYDLFTLVKEVGTRIEAAQPIELSVGNMVRRVLHIICEEAHLAYKDSVAASDRPQSESESEFQRSSVGHRSSITQQHAQQPSPLQRPSSSYQINTDTPSTPGSESAPGTPPIPTPVLGSISATSVAAAAAGSSSSKIQLRRSIHEFGSASSNASSNAGDITGMQHTIDFSLAASALGPVSDDLHDDSSIGGGSASAASRHRDGLSLVSVFQSQLVTRNLLADIKQAIEEMTDEFETSLLNISNQAWEHIHSKEIILTIGNSRTVAQFLKVAAQVREFKVIIAETAPSYEGQKMAKNLAEAGIDATLITDSAIFAMMSRVNKVILGTHGVAANGGMVSISGTSLITAAAKHYSVPVVVCSGLYKMSPKYPHDTGVFNLCVQPDPVSPFTERNENDLSAVYDNVEIINPYFDYSAPDDISLYITNVGTHPPSFIQRLIYDTYGMADIL